MTRYLPVALAAVAIGMVAILNGLTTDRWSGANKRAELCAAYLKLVPDQVGEWVGEEPEEVDSRISEVAGVTGEPVSRRYRQRETDEIVDLWLITGHSSQIVRHTPNVCYPSAGFKPNTKKDLHYDIPVEGEQPVKCWTNIFYKRTPSGGEAQVRVFWMWYKPIPGAPVRWDAPGHEVVDARDTYAGSKALYKMYFTTPARSTEEGPDESPAIRFAQEFIPELNKLLAGAAEGKPAPLPTADAEAVDPDAIDSDTGEGQPDDTEQAGASADDATVGPA